jgi:hypothetical protein
MDISDYAAESIKIIAQAGTRDFPSSDLQKVFANKIKRVQSCIDALGHHFQHLL